MSDGSSGSGGGSGGGGGGGHGAGVCSCCADAAQAAQALSLDTLYSVIDKDKLWCLNEEKTNQCKDIVKPWSARHNGKQLLSSDGDELLLFIPFIETVKFRCFSFICAGDTAPQKLKIWCNRDDIDLSNAGEIAGLQEFDLGEDNEGILEYNTKYSKFQSVSSLLFYFYSSNGGDNLSIDYLQLKGENTKGKRGIVHVVYEAKPNIADHKIPGKEENISRYTH